MDSSAMTRCLAAMIGLLLMSSAPAYAGVLKRDIPGYNPATRTMSGARQHLVVDESGKAVGYYSDGRAVERTIAGTSTLDSARFGDAFLNLARQLAWPINVGMTAYELVCQTSNICVREMTTGWELLTPGAVQGSTTPVHWAYMGGWLPDPMEEPEARAYLQTTAFERWKQMYPGNASCATLTFDASRYPNQLWYTLGGCAGGGLWASATKACPSGYTMTGDVCTVNNPQPDTWRPATDDDWNGAMPGLKGAIAGKMGSDTSAQPYLDLSGQAGMPMPVDLTWSSSSWSGPTTTTTLRDSSGNVTSIVSTTPTYTTQVTNNSTTINFNESFKTTTSNVAPDGSVTPGPTSTTDKPADPDQKPDLVELDTVEDTALQTQDVGAFTYSAAGAGGVCPADPVVTVMGHSLTIPGHVVCDYAEKLRLLVLLVFGVVSARIVASAKDAA